MLRLQSLELGYVFFFVVCELFYLRYFSCRLFHFCECVIVFNIFVHNTKVSELRPIFDSWLIKPLGELQLEIFRFTISLSVTGAQSTVRFLCRLLFAELDMGNWFLSRIERTLLLTCHFGIVGDADATHLVVTGGRHLSSATGSMATEKRKASTHTHTRVLVYG